MLRQQHHWAMPYNPIFNKASSVNCSNGLQLGSSPATHISVRLERQILHVEYAIDIWRYPPLYDKAPQLASAAVLALLARLI